MGGEITTVAPTGIAGTNVAHVQLLQADPAAEPFTSKLEKNHEGFNGVASLIGSLIDDLAKESQEANVEEVHSPGDYEEFTKESAQSRAEKVKELEELQNTKASLSASLTQSKEELAGAVTSAAETAKVISSLHQSCDWSLEKFDTDGRRPVLGRMTLRQCLLDRTFVSWATGFRVLFRTAWKCLFFCTQL